MRPFRPAILAVSAATLLAGPVLAADPVRLDKAAVEKLLPGRTINYSNVNGAAVIVTFGADGSFKYKSGNSRDSIGTWTVGDDGRYCAKITTGTAQDHCRVILKTDGGYSLRSATGELVAVSGLD